MFQTTSKTDPSPKRSAMPLPIGGPNTRSSTAVKMITLRPRVMSSAIPRTLPEGPGFFDVVSLVEGLYEGGESTGGRPESEDYPEREQSRRRVVSGEDAAQVGFDDLVDLRRHHLPEVL
jgi:hypothetical protein